MTSPRPQRADVTANRILQKRQIYRDAVFLIVEGDDDKKLFDNVVDRRRCRTQTAYGRPAVEATLRILENRAVERILAIVDADFDALERRVPWSPNLLRTDGHDAETMMLASRALESVLVEHGDEDAIERFEAEAGCTVREHLLRLASLIGYLRWLSHLYALGLAFKHLSFDRFVNRRCWTLDEDALYSQLRGVAGAGVLDREWYDREVQALRELTPDPWDLCCGHDMVKLLAIGLTGPLRRRNKPSQHRKLAPQELESALRLAYSRYFRDSGLYQALRDWARVHGVAILAADSPAER